MLVNLSQSFIPLQKIRQKGVDRPVEILMKGAGNILMTANAPNKAHAQSKFVWLKTSKRVYGNVSKQYIRGSCRQLFALGLTSFPSDWLLPCSVDLFICFPKIYFYPQFSSMRGNVTSFSPCASHRSLLIVYCFVLLTFFFVFKEYFPSGPLKPKHNFLRAKDSSKVAFRRVKNYVRFRSGRRTSCTKIERKYA